MLSPSGDTIIVERLHTKILTVVIYGLWHHGGCVLVLLSTFIYFQFIQ